LRLVVALATALALACAMGAQGASADLQVGSLGEGQSVFWDGNFVTSTRVEDPSLCGVEGKCTSYALNVTSANAKVLRVALRTADDSNGWQVLLLDPSGKQAGSGTTYTLNGAAEDFDLEVWVHDPAPGKWTIRVVPQNVKDGTFEMRAAIDPPVRPPATSKTVRTRVRTVSACHARRMHGRRVKRCVRRRLRTRHPVETAAPAGVHDTPPDLAADAPWHLTFDQPLPMVVVESGNFAAIVGLHNTNTTVAGQQLYDCLPEETLEQQAHRCLRFTSGFASLGPGPFEVYGSSSSPIAPNGGPLYQNVYRSDGTHYTRPAGGFVFHPIHAHYHVLGIAQFQVYRVESGHKLVPAGTVLKEGFCLGNIKIFDWHSFAQSEINPSSIDNCEPSPQPDGSFRFYEGIANGWEDSYKWQTSGQFASFAGNPDGYYILRVTVNPQHYVLESDAGRDANDVAYTYFKVTGSDIHTIERGHGTDPWDPHKLAENSVFGE
jgi:hypothetical protein